MKNLWKVDLEVKWSGVGDLLDETRKVVANGDGMKAIEKARKSIIGSTFEDVEDDKPVTRKALYAKVTGLELLHQIDA